MTLKKETKKLLVSKKLNKLYMVLATIVLCISFCMVGQSEVLAASTEIYEGCRYDSNNNCYYYAVAGVADAAISSSILNETYTNGTVWVKAAGGIKYTVYKEGKEYTPSDEGMFTEPGEYAISVYDNNGRQEVPLKFTILGKVGNFTRLDFPNYCRISTAKLEGNVIPASSNSVDMQNEGNYEITYKVSGGKKTETIRILIDNTAPALEFEGLNDNGEARGPVTIKKIENDSIVSIIRDGNAIDYRNRIEDSGRYRVVVRDTASNETTYQFVILPYFNFSSLIFIALCLVAVASLVAYIFILRKNMRVR